MPEPRVWETFFDVEAVLDAVGPAAHAEDGVEFGCGYGTFTLPAARRLSGTLLTLDLDEDAMNIARRRARDEGVGNIRFERRDFVRDGTGLDVMSVDYAMAFNILHHDDPVALLAEARRVLRPGGAVAIIHWNHDPETPRGPPLAMRPRPEDCLRWAREAGFDVPATTTDLPPWHYGFVAPRAAQKGD